MNLRAQTPQKPRSASKASGMEGSLIDKNRHRRKQVSFQLTESMLNKLKERPPTGDTTDSSKSRVGNKICLENTPTQKPNQNRDLLAESKKAGFFTSKQTLTRTQGLEKSSASISWLLHV